MLIFSTDRIKQFIKKKNKWHERYVKFNKQIEHEYCDIQFDIKEIEKKLKFQISSGQNFIEYSPLVLEYLKNITNKIKLNDGGILIIDYTIF